PACRVACALYYSSIGCLGSAVYSTYATQRKPRAVAAVTGALSRWPREIGAAIPLIDVLKGQTARALAGTVVAEEAHFGVLAIVSTDDVDHGLGRKDVGEIALIDPFLNNGFIG